MADQQGARLASRVLDHVAEGFAQAFGKTAELKFKIADRAALGTPKMVPSGTATLATYELGPKDGPPLIFLHGGPGMPTMPEVLQKLGDKGYHVIYFDQRGVGASTKPTDGDYGPLATLADIDTVLKAAP